MNRLLKIYTEAEHEQLDENWRQLAAAAVMTAAGMHPMQAVEKENLPTSYSQNITDSDFIDYIKEQENGVRAGFKGGIWKPHPSPEGGLPTIAYGHKIADEAELAELKAGISEEAALNLLNADIQKFKQKAADDFAAMTGRNFSDLPKSAQLMLTDIAFNLGNVRKFPKFVRALARGSVKEALSEYERSYKTEAGVVQKLDSRNAAFKKTLLDPWIVYIRAGFKPLKGPALKKDEATTAAVAKAHTSVKLPATKPQPPILQQGAKSVLVKKRTEASKPRQAATK